MDLQMEGPNFNMPDAISSPPSWKTSLMHVTVAGSTKSLQFGFPHIVRELGKVALPHRVTVDNKKLHVQEVKLKTHHQLVSYVLKMYATENAIVEIGAEIVSFMPPTGVTAVRYSNGFWENT